MQGNRGILTTILYNWVLSPLLGLLLLALHIEFKGCFAARHGRSVSNNNRVLFWFPSTSASSFTKDARTSERIRVKFSV